jgi:hypothetical protein
MEHWPVKQLEGLFGVAWGRHALEDLVLGHDEAQGLLRGNCGTEGVGCAVHDAGGTRGGEGAGGDSGADVAKDGESMLVRVVRAGRGRGRKSKARVPNALSDEVGRATIGANRRAGSEGGSNGGGLLIKEQETRAWD